MDSLKDPKTGKSFDVDFLTATVMDLARTKGWAFDWKRESKKSEVYKLVIKEDPLEIQGLISIQNRGDHVWVDLVESAPHNRGKEKKYIEVGGNLFAFAVKVSLELGYEGAIAFEAKTRLIPYYERMFGAERIGSSNLMTITGKASKNLLQRYRT